MICGNNSPYVPAVNKKDPSHRHFFFANANDFNNLSLDLNKNMASVDLYVFGHKQMKNLVSLAENIRLSGGTLCYYEHLEQRECELISE